MRYFTFFFSVYCFSFYIAKCGPTYISGAQQPHVASGHFIGEEAGQMF